MATAPKFDQVKVGDEITPIVLPPISRHQLALYCGGSGDHNPIHVDIDFAKKFGFKDVFAHGMLSAAYISAVLGTKLPGPGAIYLTQSLRFRRPVKIGDPVVTRVTVQALDERRGYVTLTTLCQVDGKTVVDGEAVVVAPRRPKDA